MTRPRVFLTAVFLIMLGGALAAPSLDPYAHLAFKPTKEVKAQVLSIMKQPKPSVVKLKALLASAEDRHRENDIAFLVGILGRRMQREKQLAVAEPLLLRSLKIYKRHRDPVGQAIALIRLTYLEESLGNQAKAMLFARQADALAEHTGDDYTLATCLNEIGYLRLILNDDSCGDYLERASKLFRKVGDLDGLAHATNLLANHYISLANRKQSANFNYTEGAKRALDAYELAVRAGTDKTFRAICQHNAAFAYFSIKDYPRGYTHAKIAMGLYSATSDGENLAMVTDIAGTCAYRIGKKTEAFEFANKARAYYVAKNIRPLRQAWSANTLGLCFQDQGRFAEALGFFQIALEIFDRLGDAQGRGASLVNKGNVLLLEGRYAESAECAEAGIAALEPIADWPFVANGYLCLGSASSELGRPEDAKKALEQCIAIAIANGLDSVRASAISSLADIESGLGHDARSLDLYKQAKDLFPRKEDENYVRTLEKMALVLIRGGRLREGLGLLREAGETARRIEQPLILAACLVDLASFYSRIGKGNLAESAFKEATPIFEKLATPSMQAQFYFQVAQFYNDRQDDQALEWLGRARYALKGVKGEEGLNLGIEAFDLFVRARSRESTLNAERLRRQIDGVESASGVTLDTIEARLLFAAVLQNTGQPQQAIDCLQKVIADSREKGADFILPAAESCLGFCYSDLHQDKVAVAFLKLAVSSTQTLRKELRTMDESFLAAFSGRVTDLYRELADALVRLGRLAEAESVMDLLKDTEYFNSVRGGHGEKVDLSPLETTWKAGLQSLGDNLAKQASDYDALARIASTRKLTLEERARKDVLDANLTSARKAFLDFLAVAKSAFTKAGVETDRIADLHSYVDLSSLVRVLPQNPVAIYTLVTKDGVRMILTLPSVTELRSGASQTIPFEVLSGKVSLLRAALMNPHYDPLPLATELYEILIRPIEKDLTDVGARSLLFSLDGPLRYLPIGALYDSRTKQYLSEKYAISLFVPSRTGKMREDPAQNGRSVGFGVTQSHDVDGIHFASLIGVSGEMAAMHRYLRAEIAEDGAFTSKTFLAAMELHPRIVHLATHFRLKPGSSPESYLLLGDGTALSIADLGSMRQGLLEGVDLLVLSACDTATPTGQEAEGEEFESLARAALEDGAASIIASLWPVNDGSTALLMGKFYELRAQHPELSKLEILRRAQSWLRTGSPKEFEGAGPRATPVTSSPQGGLKQFQTDPNHPYAHPYYWAAFVLTGNPK